MPVRKIFLRGMTLFLPEPYRPHGSDKNIFASQKNIFASQKNIFARHDSIFARTLETQRPF